MVFMPLAVSTSQGTFATLGLFSASCLDMGSNSLVHETSSFVASFPIFPIYLAIVDRFSSAFCLLGLFLALRFAFWV
ncbi:hypothetical protein QBC43DRAFT_326262 [Cladorrhinum sp. PSN259]|nr:hypothetical protein QBC43DRAFT_326262 [Cladorrhinum sp. PSN259]